MELLEKTETAEQSKLGRFLNEGLRFINAWTPTEINDGGCGIFALLLFDHLAKVGFRPELIAFTRKDEPDDVESNLVKFINNQTDASNAGALHVVVKIMVGLEVIHLDCNGVNPNSVLGLLKRQNSYNITRDQLQELYNHSTKWNPIFDRDTVPFIEDRMNFVFDHWDGFNNIDFIFPEGGINLTPKTVDAKRDRLFEIWL